MTWPIILGSTLLYEVLASAGLVRVLPAQWLPDLALLWIFVLADRTPQTAARANDVWLSGLAASAAIGYIIDVFQVAPRGLHAGLYTLTFILVRVGTDRLAQAHPVRLFMQLGIATFLAQVAVWYTKALTQSFTTLSAFGAWVFIVHAGITALFGVLLFPLLCRVFDDEQQARL